MKKLIKRAAMIATLFLACIMLPVPGWAQGVGNAPVDHFVPRCQALKDWDCMISIINADVPKTITIAFFDMNGSPAQISTSLGFADSLTIMLKAGEINETLFLRGQDFQGWIKVSAPGQIAVSAIARQYSDNALVARAEFREDQPRHAFMVPLNSNNAVAITNPYQTPTTVSENCFDVNGRPVGSSSFLLLPGQQIARFFYESPLACGGQQGTAIFSSGVGVLATAFGFDGLTFSTVQILEPPRGMGLAVSNLVGTVYFCPADVTCQDPAKIASRMKSVYKAAQTIISSELPRYGYRDKKFQTASDDNGMPLVLAVRGQKQRTDYVANSALKTADVDKEISAYIINNFPAALNWQHKMIVTDMSQIVNGQFIDIPLLYNWTNWDGRGWQGNSYLNAACFPWLQMELLANKSTYVGKPVPELGGQVMPAIPSINTTAELADSCFQYAVHELGHNLGLPFHDTETQNGSEIRYVGFMDNRGAYGFIREGGKTRAFLTGPEAAGLDQCPAMNARDFEWVKPDATPPRIQILSQTRGQTSVTVTFRASDPESAVASVAIHSLTRGRWTFNWKQLGHLDQDIIQISADNIPAGTSDLKMQAKNSQCGTAEVSLD